ncbi:MAG: sigma-70 family RNA polymerase sigma factor [Chitinophagaceae bacterium]|nr:sigma-70 family RNA polymerase sigma factor [Chitinophagaceae bacterium]
MSTSTFNDITDESLLEQFYKEKDNKWLGILLQRYTVLLLGVCMKYLKQEEEARDAVQQIFLKVISELRKYRVTYFKSWLYSVAKNYCLMQLRAKGKTHLPVTEKMIGTEDPQADAIADQQLKEDIFMALKEVLEDLNEEQKQCIKMFYLEKKSYQDIATETGYSPFQVKSYIQNGKRNLRIKLEKKIQYKNA